MKKIKLIIVLLILAILSFCIGCSYKPDEEIKLTGFNVESSIDVRITDDNPSGYYFDVKDKILNSLGDVTDSAGNSYTLEDVTFVIKDSQGAEVAHNDGRFWANDLEGYTITFALTTKSGKQFTKTTQINVFRVEFSTEYINGIRDEATLDLGITDLYDFTIKQYVLSDKGSDLVLKNADGSDFTVKATAVDVTEYYASAVNGSTGVIDTTQLDGIYVVTAENLTDNKTIYFEQMQEGKFVWNNVPSSIGAHIEGFWAESNENASPYTAGGELALAGANDSIVKDRDGVYFTFSSNFAAENIAEYYGFNLKIFPSHTKGYYESFGDAEIMMDFYFKYDGQTTDNGAQAFRSGLGFGGINQNSFDRPNLWTSGTDGEERAKYHKFTLSSLIGYWDRILSTKNMGGGFLGYANSDNASYTGDFTLYFGNIHVITNVSYTVEHYFENSNGDYVLVDSEIVNTGKDEFVNYLPLQDNMGYEFDSTHPESVLSGYNTGNLVLKGYYKLAGSAIQEKGVIYDETLYFHNINYDGYQLIQYVIRADGTVDLGDGNMGMPVDVTSAYPDLVNFSSGWIDVSGLDGIFLLTLSNGSFNHIIRFERIEQGQFVWNNMPNAQGAGVSGLYAGVAYDGNGTLTVATEGQISALNNDHKYYDENAVYYVYDSTLATETYIEGEQSGFNVKLYPVHSKAYYEQIASATDAMLLMNYYVTLDGENAPANAQISFLANEGYNTSTQVTYDDVDCWGNDVSDADETARINTARVMLGDLVANWNNVIANGVGGGFLGYSAQDTVVDYSGDFKLFFGNLTMVSGAKFKVERWLEWPDGINSFFLSETGTTTISAPYGEYITYAPETYTNYKFDESNSKNVLSGYNDGSLVIKLYYKYYLETASYTVNVYLENTNGEFVRDAGYSYTATADFMTTVTYTPVDILGYYYDTEHEGTVNSGLNRYQLVLNVYYARDPEWTLLAETLEGVRTANTLQLQATDIESLTITQYVLRDGGSAITLKKATGEEFTVNGYAVDVTDTYKNLVNLETGVIDTSALSGIFTVTAVGNNVRHAVTFEQGHTDNFVWNNLVDANSMMLKDKWGDTYLGAGTMSGAEATDPVLASKTGTYYVFNGNKSDTRHWGMKIYPVHSVEYYKMLLDINSGLEITFDFYYTADGYTANTSNFMNFHTFIYDGASSATITGFAPDTWNSSASVSLQTIVDKWAIATKITASGTGYFLGGEPSAINVTGDYKVYIGNFKFSNATYKVEHYLDGALSEEHSYYAKAAYGATINFTDITAISNFKYLPEHADGVTTGVNDGNLVIKLYYKSFNENVIYANGVRYDATLDLGVTGIETLVIKQYVVKASDSELTLKDSLGENYTIQAEAVDVTSKYASAVNKNTGIVDTSVLDGIFSIVVETADKRVSAYFEQAQEDVFTWNNLESVESVHITDNYSYEYTGNVTVEAVNSSDAALAGRTGTYFQFNSNKTDKPWGLKIFPVHTEAYYKTLTDVGTYEITFDYYYKAGEYEYVESNLSNWHNLIHGSLSESKINNIPRETWKTSESVSLNTLISKWGMICSTSSPNGYFLGSVYMSVFGDYSVYIGNVKLSNADYKVEHYLDGVLSEDYSYYLKATYGETINFTDITEITGYDYLPEHDDGVITGVNDGKLVIKLYYETSNEIILYINGLRSDSTMQLPFTTVDNFTLTQYVLRNDGEDFSVTDENGLTEVVKVKAVDVSSVYADVVDKTTGVVDTSKLDGIFTLEATSGYNFYKVTFEQIVPNQFTWNNLHSEESVHLSQRYGAAYSGTGTLSVATAQEIASTNPGDNANFNANGQYYKFVTANSQETDGVNLRVYPSHSKSYYQDWCNKYPDAKMTIPFNFTTGNTNAEGYAWYNFAEGQINYTGEDTWGVYGTAGWRDRKTFTLSSLLDNWSVATSTSSTGMLGYKKGSWVTAGALTIYFGSPFYTTSEFALNPLYGKKVSVLGDSVSSYYGYSNNATIFNSTIGQNQAGYGTVGYGDDLTSVNDTWWMQTINNIGAELMVNNSSGGSRVFLDRSDIYGPAAYRDIRALELHDDTNPADARDTDYVVDPDIIMIYAGLNDHNTRSMTIGTFEAINFDTLITVNGAGTYTYATPATFAEAYAIMIHKIVTRYSSADVFIANLPAGVFETTNDPVEINDAIAKIAAKYGATLIDFYGTELSGTQYSTYAFDGIHPKKAGMTILANKATEAINAKYASVE